MTQSALQSTALRVIQAEQSALGALAETLGPSFDQAVETLLSCQGRIIVTGIGKSGHIARKIAATLASTGSPAQFVHPAEASHGDLGMITTTDAVLALSNSGEAPELANLLRFARRFGIPLIGMTSRPESSLAKQSDIVLQLPNVGEACGTGIVPTSSTTMTLALGDALAVALMEHRAFTADHFREFHPGGKLGAQLSRVSDLMHTGASLPLVKTGTQMPDALLEMSEKGFGVVGVTDAKGALIGIVTDGDLRRNMQGLLDRTVDDVMTKSPRTIAPGDMAETAVGVMTMPSPRITCLFVVAEDDPAPLGLIHIHDCLRVGLG